VDFGLADAKAGTFRLIAGVVLGLYAGDRLAIASESNLSQLQLNAAGPQAQGRASISDRLNVRMPGQPVAETQGVV
jgi:hypothetical protein